MREIRPIRADEAEAFLRLLCDVFDLDFNRAKGIFFSEPLFELSRKWALFEAGEMLSILTTVPLQFGWGNAIGIAGVATKVEGQGQGLAGALLAHVLSASTENHEGPALLFAKDNRLYARAGFGEVDQVIRGEIVSVPEPEVPDLVSFTQIEDAYTAWSEKDPNRLRRDARRWSYWKWNLRICTPFHGGYICSEGHVIREVVIDEPAAEWPLPAGTEWLGLSSMARMLGLAMKEETVDLHLMAHGFPGQPQMFMTDQF